jgi:hypothetical protein
MENKVLLETNTVISKMLAKRKLKPYYQVKPKL